MKKVAVKNFIRDFIYSKLSNSQRKLSALVDTALNFPQRHQSRFPFRSFLVSFACIAEELLRLYSHCHFLLVQGRMVLVCRH